MPIQNGLAVIVQIVQTMLTGAMSDAGMPEPRTLSKSSQLHPI
jgi:hypothetical protein